MNLQEKNLSHADAEKKPWQKQRIAFTGGGSGWHIFPLLSLYKHLQEDNNYEFLWIGEENSLEEDIAMKNNIAFRDISSGKIRRNFDRRNMYEPLKNLSGIFQGLYYIRKYRIDIVISKWGYVSLPLSIAAWIMRKKVFIHESDVKTGLSNKLVEKFATKAFFTFHNIKIDNKKYFLSGQILNPDLLEWLDSLEIEQNARLNVVVIGGSQGSMIIFQSLLEAMLELSDVDFHIVLGTKNKEFREKFSEFSHVQCYDFLTQKDMGKLLKKCDIALTRGSATVLWELFYFWLHSIIVPITQIGDHQKYNAEYFQKKYGSDVLDENHYLTQNIAKKINSYKHLRKQGLNLDGFFKPLRIIEKEIQN